nr:ImmA/IrrE family metallo-endopeptidase [Sphingomonas sp. IC-56]
MGLSSEAPLCPWHYADTLNVIVFEATDLDLDPEHAEQLLVKDSSSWSGMTLFEEGVYVVVLNSAHSRERRAATLMHELAHIILEHVPADVDVSPSGLVLLSDFSRDQEDEADWLGGALLLPEAALTKSRYSGISIIDIAKKYGVSEQLCSWRCKMTGVEKRLSFRQRS